MGACQELPLNGLSTKPLPLDKFLASKNLQFTRRPFVHSLRRTCLNSLSRFYPPPFLCLCVCVCNSCSTKKGFRMLPHFLLFSLYIPQFFTPHPWKKKQKTNVSDRLTMAAISIHFLHTKTHRGWECGGGCFFFTFPKLPLRIKPLFLIC